MGGCERSQQACEVLLSDTAGPTEKETAAALSARDEKGWGVAVVSLLPDPGHLVPLLKIAAHVPAPGKVKVFVPDELVEFAASKGFQATGLGPVRPAGGQEEMQDYIAASELRRVTGAFRAYHETYFQPLMAAVNAMSAPLQAHLRDFRPTVVLIDEHAMPAGFKRALRDLKARWFLHSPAPNYKGHNTWSIKNCWWVDGRTAARDVWAKTANEYRLWMKRRRRGRAEAPAGGRRGDSAIPAGVGSGKSARLSSGKCVIERTFLADRLLYTSEDRIVLPALPPLAASMDAALASWLDERQEKSVAYVSFGTMVRPPLRLLEEIVRAVLAQGRQVLLQYDGPFESHAGVRREPWVAQQEVLAHPAVGMFVSHGGAGSIEEALWAGVPTLSIPRIWDHRFNAWVAEALGTGVYLRRGWNATPSQLRTALRRALDPALDEQARLYARFMHEDWAANERAVQALFRP
jgi:UDP:flavonoid glycosyltransferase YjiC (YdhE family)